MACPRIQYRRRTHYATRSNRFKLVRTPGNRLVAQKRAKKHNGPMTPWALGHKRLAGTKALGHFDRRRASRYVKTVSRPYGGVLNGEQVKDRVLRAFLIEEQRIVKKVLQAEAKYQKEKKRRELKSKKRLEKKKATQKKKPVKKTGPAVTKQSGKKVQPAKKAAPAKKVEKKAAPAKKVEKKAPAKAPAKAAAKKK